MEEHNQEYLSNPTKYAFVGIYSDLENEMGFPGWHQWCCLPMQETEVPWVQSLGQEDPLENEIATHSSFLAWKIPWTEEPSGIQSMGWQRMEHN